jgi:hypothetical protein
MNGRDEGEGIWLMGFIYIYEIEQWKSLTIALMEGGFRKQGEGDWWGQSNQCTM